MPAKPEPVIDAAVVELYDIDAEIDRLQTLRKAVAQILIDQGEGTYIESAEPHARKVVVVVPSKWSTKYDLYAKPFLDRFLAGRELKKATPELVKDFRKEQEAAARNLLGGHFETCFDRVVSFAPAKAYADMIPRLFPTAPAKAKNALLLCQLATPPKDAYIRLPDKPKTAAAGESEEEE